MDHNKHYEYFRKLIYSKFHGEHEIVNLIHKDKKIPKLSKSEKIKNRLAVEKKLFRLSRKNGELFEYIKNRVLGLFFNKYKRQYDRFKLSFIDGYFSKLSQELPEISDNVYEIENINDEKKLIEEINPDMMIVVGAPFIKKHIIDIPCKKINLHIGYLPNYRGIKTIEWALLNNEFDKVAYSVHELTSELDKGLLIHREAIDIDRNNLNLAKIYTSLYHKAFNALVGLVKNNEFDNYIDEPTLEFKIYNNYKFNPLDYKKLMPKRFKMAIFAGNPVQYHVPIYKALAQEKDVDLTVMYGSDIGAKKFYSKEFKSYIEWDIPLLEGYEYKFFRNFTSKKLKGMFSRINLGMFFHIIFNRYDAVLIHGYDTVSSWIVYLGAKLSGTKIIWRGEAAIRPQNRQNALKKFVKTKLLPLYFKSCDAVMYSCTGNRLYLEQFNISSEKMFLIPCAVDNNFFREKKAVLQPKRDELRNALGIDEEEFVILFTARFTTRKRPLDLIEAISRLNHSNVVMLFVGDGLERENMERELKKHKIKNIITGFVGQNELPKYYVVADLYAIVSDYDASPKSLNEALNFDLPILVTDKVGTSSDLVKNDENGYIVSSRDIKQLSEKIDFFVNNPEITKEMGCNSIELSNLFSIENDVKGIKKALEYVNIKSKR